MMFTTYILFSEPINRYYVGSTGKPIQSRLKKHLTNHKGFTGKAMDWIVVYSIEFDSVKESRTLEKRIKKRGAARFLSDLNGK